MAQAEGIQDTSGRDGEAEEVQYRVGSAELISARRLMERIERGLFYTRAYTEWTAYVKVTNHLAHLQGCNACQEYYCGD